jgi:hypothetical protein
MNMQVRGFAHTLNPDARACAQDLSHSSEMNPHVRILTHGQAKGMAFVVDALLSVLFDPIDDERHKEKCR